ncbi:hypothetical protein YC2023_104665 [Brassica napus]
MRSWLDMINITSLLLRNLVTLFTPLSFSSSSTWSILVNRLNHAHAARRSPVVAVQEIVKDKKPTNSLVCFLKPSYDSDKY